MARRALIVGTGVADRIAAGLEHRFDVDRVPEANAYDLVVWADYPSVSCRPAPIVSLSPEDWANACDRPLRNAIDLARSVHPALAATSGTIVFLVPLMASAGGAGYTALAGLGEGVRILAKSLRPNALTFAPTSSSVDLATRRFIYDMPPTRNRKNKAKAKERRRIVRQ